MKNPQIKEGFEVEWTTDLGEQVDGDFNPDNVKYQNRDFAEHKDAIAFAYRVLPQDLIGEVRVTPFHLEQYEPGVPAYYREYDGNPELVS